MSKILIVEDEEHLASAVADWLKRDNHTVEIVGNGQEAMARLGVYKYDLLILDLMLPGLNGIEICRRFRGSSGVTPILMLTARDTIDDKSAGLDAGADDYLTKPFHLKELSSRVRALLRRSPQFSGDSLAFGSLVLDTAAGRLTKDGQDIYLLPREFNLLEFFMRHPNQLFTAEALLERVWVSDTMASCDTVRTHIKTLRRKIDTEGQPSRVTNIPGKGYRFEGADV